MKGDPHVSLPGLVPPNQTEYTEFVFDFHGLPNKAYCMFTDTHLSVSCRQAYQSNSTSSKSNVRVSS